MTHIYHTEVIAFTFRSQPLTLARCINYSDVTHLLAINHQNSVRRASLRRIGGVNAGFDRSHPVMFCNNICYFNRSVNTTYVYFTISLCILIH